MKSPKIILVFLFGSILSGSASATAGKEDYGQPWRWIHFTSESGLPSNNILKVVVTTGGEYWASTTHGLAWYDNFKWVPIDSGSGLPQNQAYDIQDDLNGELLVNLEGVLYRGNKDGFQKLPIPRVGSAVPMSKDTILVLLNDTLFTFQHNSLEHFRSDLPVVHDGELALSRTDDGKLWMTVNGSLYYLAGSTWKLKLSSDGHLDKYFFLQEEMDGMGLAYNSASRDILTWDHGSQPTPFMRAQEVVRMITMGPSGQIIIAYESGEVMLYQNRTLSPFPSIEKIVTRINSLLFESSGDLWVSSEEGLFKYRRSLSRWTYRKQPSPDGRNLVNEIVVARDGSIWLGEDAGVEVVHPNGMSTMIDRINGRRIVSITGLAEDSDGNIWISSGIAFSGAYRWNGQAWDYFSISKDSDGIYVHKIFKDRKGRLWFAGLLNSTPYDQKQPGAYVFENGIFTRWGKEEGLISGRVYAFAEGNDGSYWFGTWGGLNRWKDGKWTQWRHGKNFISGAIYNIAIDHDDRVWFSDLHSGLGYLDQLDIVHYISDAQGLVSNHIRAIAISPDGTLWVGGVGGVGRFRDSIWSNFTVKDGLNNPSVYAVCVSPRNVYFGTIGGGLNILALDEMKAPPPQLSIDKPIVDGSDVFLRWRVFPYGQEISSSDALTRYHVDKDGWSPWSTSREIGIKGMSYGDHLINVQAKGLFGNFDAGGTSQPFSISPPYYLHLQFLAPLVGLLGMVLILSVRLLRKNLRTAAALRKSELKFRRLASATFEGILIHNGGIIVDANQSAVNLFGYEFHDLIGRQVTDLIASEPRAIMQEWLLSESEAIYEAVGVRRDGSRITVEIIGKSFPYEDQTARVVAIRDITDRKIAEQRLLDYQQQLQSLASRLSITEEQERRRMATYLHDYIGQTLALCKIKLARPLSSEAESQARQFEDIRGLLDQMIQNTQSLTFELSPPVLYELEFEDAIEWLTEQMQEQYSIVFSFEDDGAAKPLNSDVRILLFHAVRELLVNVVKHAHAEKARVSLRRVASRIAIEVTDDGTGFTPNGRMTHANKNGGYGLFNIRERMGYFGGEVHIHSGEPHGTSITLFAPLDISNDQDRANLG